MYYSTVKKKRLSYLCNAFNVISMTDYFPANIHVRAQLARNRGNRVGGS